MKKNRTAKKREHSGSVNLLGLLFLPLLVSGCNSHDSRFSYFNMLDSEKITVQNKNAAEKFWSSVRPVSTLSVSHYKLGRYYQQQGKYDKSIEEFSKAVRNDSGYCKAYNGIAMSYDALNRCEMASNSYEQAIQCAPQEAYVKNNYACSSILCGNYEKGLALLLEAAQLSKDHSRIKNNIKLAQMLVERENNLAKSAPQGATVALVAKTDEEPAENEAKKSQPDPMFAKADNPAPGETPHGDGVDRETVETPAKSSAGSPVPANDLAAQTPPVGKATEMVRLPTTDAAVDSNEAKLESNKNNIKLAQMLVERENMLAKSAPQGATVALAAKTDEEPAENEAKKSQPDPMYAHAGNSTPGETSHGDGVDRETVETPAKNSAESPVAAHDLAAQIPPMGKAKEMVSLPTTDAAVVSNEAELESSLQKNIVIASLVIETTKKISVQGHTEPPVNDSNGAIEVSNGNGVTGMAGRSADYFRCYGFTVGRITNAEYFRVHDSVIFYREGFLQMAEELAKITPGVQDIEKVESLGRSSIGIRILLGKDLANIQFPKGYAQNFAYSRSKTAYNISSISNMNKLSVTY